MNSSELSTSFFNIQISNETAKKRKEHDYVKNYMKSEKNRSQVVNQVLKDTNKLQSRLKGRKRNFLKNDCFIF